MGASHGFEVGGVGGSWGHAHAVSAAAHNHYLVPGQDLAQGEDPSWSIDTTENTQALTARPIRHLPPYLALHFIMRVGEGSGVW